jgi:hypothetical protein
MTTAAKTAVTTQNHHRFHRGGLLELLLDHLAAAAAVPLGVVVVYVLCGRCFGVFLGLPACAKSYFVSVTAFAMLSRRWCVLGAVVATACSSAGGTCKAVLAAGAYLILARALKEHSEVVSS